MKLNKNSYLLRKIEKSEKLKANNRMKTHNRKPLNMKIFSNENSLDFEPLAIEKKEEKIKKHDLWNQRG